MGRASEGKIVKTHNPIVNVYPVDPANSFRVDGKVNGKPVSFLLDTGAAVSLIRKDIWDSLEWGTDLTTWSSDAQLVGVDGSPLPVCGCIQMMLNLGGKMEYPVQIIVVESLTPGAILGLDFLRDNDCIIDIAERRLHFPRHSTAVPLQQTDNSHVNKIVNVHLVSTIRVPAYSEMELLAEPQVQVMGTWLVERTPPNLRVPVIVARGVVNASTGGVPMRILNPTDEAVMIPKGKTIAVMEPLSDDSIKCLNISAVQQQDQSPLSEEKQLMLWEIVEKCGTQLTCRS